MILGETLLEKDLHAAKIELDDAFSRLAAISGLNIESPIDHTAITGLGTSERFSSHVEDISTLTAYINQCVQALTTVGANTGERTYHPQLPRLSSGYEPPTFAHAEQRERDVFFADPRDFILPRDPNVTLDTLILSPETKLKFQDLALYIQYRQRITARGGRVPKGFILNGPPGCGKTSIMRALTNMREGVEVFYIDASDFKSKWINQGLGQITLLLENIKQYCAEHGVYGIIFFDEFESIARKRDMESNMGKSDADELNALLKFIDGLKSASTEVTIVGATNMKDALDPAILRGGRCDESIDIPLPNIAGIGEFIIKKLNSLDTLIGEEIFLPFDIEKVAQECEGMSFADIENVFSKLCSKRALQEILDNQQYYPHRRVMVMIDGENLLDAITTEKASREIKEKKGKDYQEMGGFLAGMKRAA